MKITQEYQQAKIADEKFNVKSVWNVCQINIVKENVRENATETKKNSLHV